MKVFKYMFKEKEDGYITNYNVCGLCFLFAHSFSEQHYYRAIKFINKVLLVLPRIIYGKIHGNSAKFDRIIMNYFHISIDLLEF